MAINDDNIGWNTKRIFIPVRTMTGVLDDGTSGVPASLGAGGMDFAEILAAAEIAGMRLGADNDEVYHFWPLPWDLDITQPLRFRVWFVHNSTDADTPIFTIEYKGIGKQAAISDAKSSEDELLTFGAHTCSTTNNSLEITAWKESNSHEVASGASTARIASTDFAILFALTATTMSASANEIVLLGVEIEYVVKAAPNTFRKTTEKQPTTASGPNT